ncbi:4Fe-4S ferredoxin [Pseudonocardiaceae bacterium YIM PH 21723]|nr:4Fe-4S ferredoxin [Pseudonocardiaceae bacterium YIM PH 21723]
MPYVVTQSCCADASCVVACPVNCIHPAPGEPGFGTAEMLFVDPKTCVDCGACTTACPVDALVPHTRLTEAQLPFMQLNADYYKDNPHSDRTPLALIPPKRLLRRTKAARIAIVGAGPSGMYLADELLKHGQLDVDVYDRLTTPYGLARYGVAPDHRATRGVTKVFQAIERVEGFDYQLGVRIGEDVTHEELAAHYHAVVYCTGASTGRKLDIPGEGLPGSITGPQFVAWYNGHPDVIEPPAGLLSGLASGRAVVIGNGNVALDIARLLTTDPEHLADTDISLSALEALRNSAIDEVVLLGRRGAVNAAFTLPELIGLAGVEDITVVVDGECGDDTPKTKLLAEMAARPPRGKRRIVFRFETTSAQIHGEDKVTGLEVTRGGVNETLDAGLVISSIGYRGSAVPGLPFDEVTGRMTNEDGRVAPGIYTAGWIKRGPSGFIGTNKGCAEQTAKLLLDDLDGGLLPEPKGSHKDIRKLIARRNGNVLDLAALRA